MKHDRLAQSIIVGKETMKDTQVGTLASLMQHMQAGPTSMHRLVLPPCTGSIVGSSSLRSGLQSRQHHT